MRLRSLVGAIGVTVAVLVALAGPIGYATVSYHERAEILGFKAELNADRLARYIYSHDKLAWARLFSCPKARPIQSDNAS
jgi:hypothetical protein